MKKLLLIAWAVLGALFCWQDMALADESSTNGAPLVAGAGQSSDPDLDVYAGITPSANVQALLGAANYSAMRTLLSLAVGTDVQGYSALLADIAGLSLANGDILYFNGTDIVKLSAGTANYLLQANGAAAPSWSSSLSISGIDLGAGTIILPTSTSDAALTTVGAVSFNSTDEQLSFHSGSTGKISGEVALSLIQHTTLVIDPAWAYDQSATYRTVPLFYVGDDFVEGMTLDAWRVRYVSGDPTTELDADLVCDTTPDFNSAAGGTVMDVLDTTAGASSAASGFDSATCANGGQLYLHFGADPADANVMISVDIWYHAEED